jgi:hypothetical protein
VILHAYIDESIGANRTFALGAILRSLGMGLVYDYRHWPILPPLGGTHGAR